jgi:hypothetical protein
MNTVLVIAALDSTRNAWCHAVRQRGMKCRQASALLGALDHLIDPTLAGIVFRSMNDDDLSELIALSTVHALPPIVIVSGPTSVPFATRFTAGTIIDPSASSARVMARLTCMVNGRQLMSPTNLPVRLSPLAEAQWTVRLSAEAHGRDDDSFDGATQPEGFDLAARA